MATKDSSLKPSPTANTKPNRLPAPTLFVGPPSRNASQLSVSRQLNDKAASRDALMRHQTALNRSNNTQDFNTATGSNNTRNGTTNPPNLRKSSGRTIDAKWREMQSTLNEVEITAQSSTHVFGASHAAALDELRKAQVELARAWGRSNDEQSSQQPTGGGGGGGEAEAQRAFSMNRYQGADDIANDRAGTMNRKRGDTESSVSTTLSGETATSEGTVRSGASMLLEDETAQDIRLASERRAANEAYFRKVDQGVKDVVAKLEVVAEAMRGVEGESRSLWSGSERSSGETGGKGRVQTRVES